MPRTDRHPVPLAGIALSDARTGAVLDLGARPGRYLLTAIRHRH